MNNQKATNLKLNFERYITLKIHIYKIWYSFRELLNFFTKGKPKYRSKKIIIAMLKFEINYIK